MNILLEDQANPGQRCVQDIDRQIGARILEHRVILGLTQRELAELIGVTYQQAHKYEQGKNRISASRLYMIAHALGVDVSFFFDDRMSNTEVKPPQRLLLEFVSHFRSLSSRKQQEALCCVVRVVAGVDNE
jgi:transcriptional regulator with XRE-family HTH domain